MIDLPVVWHIFNKKNCVFEGEKAIVFWIGLILLGLASVGLFGIL